MFFLNVLGHFFFKNDVYLKRCTFLWSELLYSLVIFVHFLVFELLLIFYFTVVDSDLDLCIAWQVNSVTNYLQRLPSRRRLCGSVPMRPEAWTSNCIQVSKYWRNFFVQKWPIYRKDGQYFEIDFLSSISGFFSSNFWYMVNFVFKSG